MCNFAPTLSRLLAVLVASLVPGCKNNRDESTRSTLTGPETKNVGAIQHDSRVETETYLNSATIMHPNGNEYWGRWGIEPKVLTQSQCMERANTVSALLRRQVDRENVFSELTYDVPIKKSSPLLHILDVDALPRAHSELRTLLSDDDLRNVNQSLKLDEIMPFDENLPHRRIIYSDPANKTELRVQVFYGDSSADAFCHLVGSFSYTFSAPIGLILPTCRIENGPGDLCWIGWNRGTAEEPFYFPSEERILFLRGGVAVYVWDDGASERSSAMVLAQSIDKLIMKQMKIAE